MPLWYAVHHSQRSPTRAASSTFVPEEVVLITGPYHDLVEGLFQMKGNSCRKVGKSFMGYEARTEFSIPF